MTTPAEVLMHSENSSNKNIWLLINYSSAQMLAFPFGLAYISSTLKTDPRLAVHCLNLRTVPGHLHLDTISRKIIETGASVVGIGGYSQHLPQAREITLYIRRQHPEVTLVGGGPIVSSDPILVHELLDLDYGVCGEGEETVLELANHLLAGTDPTHIAGLVFQHADGQRTKTHERKPTKDIDDIPWPDWDGWDIQAYMDVDYHNGDWRLTYTDHPRCAPILLSRSCPYRCTFCFHSIKNFRMRKMDAIFKEVNALIEKYQINGLNLYDDLFSVNTKRIIEFSQRLEPTGLYWSTQLRANIADKPEFPEVLAHMRKAKCYSCAFGLETMDDNILRSMRKKVTAAQTEKAFHMTYSAGIHTLGNFIWGDTVETLETANHSLNWWVLNRRYLLQFFAIIVLPGTELYQTSVQSGRIPDARQHLLNGCPHVNVSMMPDSDFYELRLASFMAEYTLDFPAHIKSIEPSPTDPQRWKVTAVCPHCGEITIYNAVNIHYKRVYCKSCNGGLHLSHYMMLWRHMMPEPHMAMVMQATQLLHTYVNSRDATLIEQILTLTQPLVDGCRHHIDARYVRGTVLMLAGRVREAKLEYEYGLGLSPSSLEASFLASPSATFQNNYGVALCMVGQLGWGLLRFQQALALDPNCSTARNNAQAVLEYLLERQYKTMPFTTFFNDFTSHKQVYLIIGLMTFVSPAWWPPIRTSSVHPFVCGMLDLSADPLAALRNLPTNSG